MATNLSENGKLKLDLFSLRFFQSLYRCGSLTRTAEEHGLPIGSASRQLSRLREFFGDTLFTHCGNGMAPTHRADRLMPQIDNILVHLDQLLVDEVFEPSSIRACIRIGLVDNAALTFVAPRVAALEEACPNISLELIPLYDDFYSLLTNDQLDFAVYPFEKPPERQGFHFLKIDQVTFSYVVRKHHPLTVSEGGPGFATEADAEKYRMIRIRRHSGSAVSPTGASVKNQTVRDQVAVYTSYFTSSVFFLFETDHILVLPTATAKYLSTMMPIEVLNLCPDSPPMEMYLIWHERAHNSPTLQWVRSFLISQSISRLWKNLAMKRSKKSASCKEESEAA